MAPVLSVLTRNRDFRYLFLAELVVFGGDWFAMIPLITLLQELTGSGLPGALALTADTAATALLLPFAGTLADRYDRRTIMMVANIGSMAAVALLFAVQSAALAWIGPVALALAAAAKAFYTPAASAALPNVVDPKDLAAANVLAGSAWGTMLVVGASLGGIVSAAFGPYASFAVTLICLAMSAWLVWKVRRPLQADDERRAAPSTPLRAIGEVLVYIRRQPRVLSLVTVKTAVGLGNGVLAVFPLLATVVFPIGSLGTGLLFAARGLGALIGPMVIRRVLGRRRWLMPGLAVSMCVYGLSYLGVAVSPWFWLVVVLATVAHLAGGGNWMMSNYALQLQVPDAMRGRVFATDIMIATLAISVSLLVVGTLVDYVEPRILVAGCGTVTLLYGLGWGLATRHQARVAVAELADERAAGPTVVDPTGVVAPNQPRRGS